MTAIHPRSRLGSVLSRSQKSLFDGFSSFASKFWEKDAKVKVTLPSSPIRLSLKSEPPTQPEERALKLLNPI